MSDELLFAEEDDSLASEDSTTHVPWKVLIVDDEPEVHSITRLALCDFVFDGRSLEFLSAHSGAEAKQLISQHPDTALMFLDVVMETDDAGLQVARHVRDEAKNNMTRIVLRTGQPGQAPERRVILDYDINDYKTKTELTSQKLFTTAVASLRSFRDLDTIQQNRRGLEKIIEASSSLFEILSMEKFVQGVLTQLVSLLGMQRDAFYCSSCFVSGSEAESLYLLAGAGHFEGLGQKPAPEVVAPEIMAFLETALMRRESLFEPERMVIYFEDSQRHKNMIYMEAQHSLDEVDRTLLEVFCSNVAVAFGNVRLNQEIESTLREIVHRLASVAETRSKETGNHIHRVAAYCRHLAELAGIDEEEAELLAQAATLHDIGKVSVPDEILNKPGRLTAEEFEVMKGHSQAGHQLFADSERPMLRTASIIARDHHERYDGKGYPNGLAGEQIHFYGRIAAIADVFDALSMDRVYKKAWPLEQIREHFAGERGTHFDPQLIDLFLAHFDEFAAIRRQLADSQPAGA
ncbi:DUF3369 domain-containing protein [Marinospirillum sp.]|uniref:DUF3369 domain-containing protein n=1 Tax=Marinospirillum sp. TaxID=2183934 RepID=UPI00385072C6